MSFAHSLTALPEFQRHCKALGSSYERCPDIVRYLDTVTDNAILHGIPKNVNLVDLVDTLLDEDNVTIFDQPVAYRGYTDNDWAPFYAMIKLLAIQDARRDDMMLLRQVELLSATYDVLLEGRDLEDQNVLGAHRLFNGRAGRPVPNDGLQIFERERFLYAFSDSETIDVPMIASRRVHPEDRFAIPTPDQKIMTYRNMDQHMNARANRRWANVIEPFVKKISGILRP